MLILDHVRTLSDTAFKILAVTTGLLALQPGRRGRISARELAESANISRRSVQYGLDDLAHKGLISITGGAGPKAPTITLTYLGIERFTGANFAPVDGLFPQATGANSTPLNQARGANFAPVNTDEGGPAGARVESIDLRTDIDRLQKQPEENTIIGNVLRDTPDRAARAV